MQEDHATGADDESSAAAGTTRRSVIVVGASAGGVEALGDFVAGLPADLPATVLVVLHVPQDGASVLPAILDRRGPLPAAHAVDGQPLVEGHLYVAPPDHHLIVHDERLALSRGPRENGHRPAVDVLFRTAARSFGERLIGVVLSGTLDDGAAGLATIASRGGDCVVQDPADALFPAMPRHALERVNTPHVLPAHQIGQTLDRLCREPVPALAREAPTLLEREFAMAGFEADELSDVNRPGSPAGFGCPDCAGALFEIRDGDVTRYRCRVGHGWTGHGLLAQHHVALESALWLALRTLEDRAALSLRMAGQATERGSSHSARRFEQTATDAKRAAEEIARLLRGGSPVTRVEDQSANEGGR